MADSGLGKAPSLAAILSYPARPGDHSLGAAPPAVHVPHRASPCRLPPGAPLPAELFPAPPPPARYDLVSQAAGNGRRLQVMAHLTVGARRLLR
jgi:hypothetical protein